MKIMIVDDNVLLQLRLTEALRKVDEMMSILKASRWKEPADLFLPFELDTVILDIAQPDGSGITLLQLI